MVKGVKVLQGAAMLDFNNQLRHWPVGLARMPFFRLRILVGFSERIFEYSFQKKTPSKKTLIIPIYSLEPIWTVSAYFVEDLIAFER